MAIIKCLLVAIVHLIKTGDWQPHEFVHIDEYYKMTDGQFTHYHIWCCKYCQHEEVSAMPVMGHKLNNYTN